MRRRGQALPVADRILYEDNHLIIVNKLAGELVQGDRTGDSTLGDDIKAFLKKKYNKPGDAFLGVVHRLDRPTSGAVIFAKTSKGLTRMTNAFRDRKVKKIYRALIESQPESDSATLTHWLFKDREKNKAIVYRTPKGAAKKAVLTYTVIARITDHYMVEIELGTGRHHQIRAQLSSIKCPIVGDTKYGYPRMMKDKSIALHAHSLSFEHPVSKESISVVAPPPRLQLWSKFV